MVLAVETEEGLDHKARMLGHTSLKVIKTLLKSTPVPDGTEVISPCLVVEEGVLCQVSIVRDRKTVHFLGQFIATHSEMRRLVFDHLVELIQARCESVAYWIAAKLNPKEPSDGPT